MSHCLQPFFSASVLWLGAWDGYPWATRTHSPNQVCPPRRPEPCILPTKWPWARPARQTAAWVQAHTGRLVAGTKVPDRWQSGAEQGRELATCPAGGGAPARRPPLGPVRGAGGQESPPWRWVDTPQSSRSTRPCVRTGMEASGDRPAVASTLGSAGLPHCPRQAGSWHHLVTAWMGGPPLKPLAAPQGPPPTPWSWQPRQPLSPGVGALDTVWGPGSHTSLQDN